MSSAVQPAVETPLSSAGLDALEAAVAGCNRDQLLWSSGYLAGLAQAEPAHPAPAAAPSANEALTVFFATETGNSRSVAEDIANRAGLRGLTASVQDLARFKPRRLTKISRALFVIATHGIGDPPEGTEPFFELWLGENAPQLEKLQYSVLALGDSSYADFCEAGRQLDETLAKLGATRLIERVDCDVDYHDPAERWAVDAVQKTSELAGTATAGRARLHAIKPDAAVSRGRPFDAAILVNQRITGNGSSKDVRHIELDLEESGMQYLPGDSLGIRAANPPQIVDAILQASRLDGDDSVTVGGEQLPLAAALTAKFEITALSRPLLDTIAGQHGRLAEILADREQLRSLFRKQQVVDVLHDYPVDWTAQSFADALRRLPPRLYSIASSPDANPGEAHLTVGVVNYQHFGREHWGSASGYLATDVRSAPVYVESNPQFRLPEDGRTPIIMIGAGTGIAPYRAFVEHRREHGQRGPNWLIFGDRNFASDFLYQQEWLQHRKEGYLDRIDVAFSRDESAKVYVQHRIAGAGRRFLDWLDRGAVIYVCGDAERMAGDVHESMMAILQNDGGLSADAAADHLAELRAAGRYQRDVY